MAASFKPDMSELERALGAALVWTSQFLQAEIAAITPRDPERLPINTIDRKDGKAPYRSTYYKPVLVGGHWYPGVSGKLKQSVVSEEVSAYEHKIGVAEGPTSEYAKYLEFGTLRMRPRSFLREWIDRNSAKALKVFESLMKKRLW